MLCGLPVAMGFLRADHFGTSFECSVSLLTHYCFVSGR